MPENISSAGIGIKIVWSPTEINNQLKQIQTYLDSKHLDIKMNLSQEAIKGLEQIGKVAQSSAGEVSKLNSSLSGGNVGTGYTKLTQKLSSDFKTVTASITETKIGVGQLEQVFQSLQKNRRGNWFKIRYNRKNGSNKFRTTKTCYRKINCRTNNFEKFNESSNKHSVVTTISNKC